MRVNIIRSYCGPVTDDNSFILYSKKFIINLIQF